MQPDANHSPTQQFVVLDIPQGAGVLTGTPSKPFHSGDSLKDDSLVFLFTHRQNRPRRSVRSQSAIVVAILDACRTPNPQHWIMVKARLGYDTFWHHMNKLLSMGVMDETNEGNKTLYRVNAKGLDLLSQLTGV
ncbi:MAG TPA: winged helix-turn-helix domain-containing protein [Nitrososphaerales archaeon]|nr:winged helix-turn-helix domain-containing protein [Nitrososphaerales archaeon]